MNRIPLLLCILALSVALSSFLRSEPCAQIKTDEARSGGVYRAPLLNNPSSLDPAHVQDMYGVAVVQQLFDGLVQFTPDLFVAPALAENWQVEEQGRVYRFFLRKNARFHNGRPMSSKDVVFSLKRLLRVNPPPSILPHLLKISGAQEYSAHKTEEVIGLEPVDDLTVAVRLNQPYVPFLVALGMYQAKIVPSEEVAVNEKEFGQNPIGSGPFRFVRWQKDEAIRLERFPEYYAGPALLDSINYKIYPGVQIDEVLADFMNGELEQMPIFGKVGLKLRDNKQLHLVHRSSLGIQFYGLNSQHPHLRDPNLRKALSIAIDRKELIARVYDGRFESAKSILPPGMPGYSPSGPRVDEDRDQALQLVKTARKEKAIAIGPIEIVSNSQSPLAQAELDFVRESWKRLGISMEPRFIPDWSEFETYVKSDSMQIYRYAWFAAIPDPDEFLRNLFSSDSPTNFMRYKNSDVDTKLQEALGIVDPIQRAEAYQSIERIVLQSSPIIPILFMSDDFVFQPYVEGVAISPLGAQKMSFYGVWLKKNSSL